MHLCFAAFCKSWGVEMGAEMQDYTSRNLPVASPGLNMPPSPSFKPQAEEPTQVASVCLRSLREHLAKEVSPLVRQFNLNLRFVRESMPFVLQFCGRDLPVHSVVLH